MWVIHIEEAQSVYTREFFLFRAKTKTNYLESLKLFKAELKKVFTEDAEANPIRSMTPCRSYRASSFQSSNPATAVDEIRCNGPAFIVLEFELVQAAAFRLAFPLFKTQGFLFCFRQTVNPKVRAFKELRELQAKNSSMECTSPLPYL